MKSIKIDIRAAIAIVVIAAVIVFVMQTEEVLLLFLITVALWLFIQGYGKPAVKYIFMYVGLWGMILLMRNNRIFGNMPALLTSARHVLIPCMAAVPISRASTGEFIASLNQMKIPRPITLSFSILFRFMPMVKSEFRLIRNSQKFRGIGVSVLQTVCHPVKTIEYILVPLMIRTSRIADELSASAVVRGMRLEGRGTSYHQVKWSVWDSVFVILYLGIVTALIIFDRKLRG